MNISPQDLRDILSANPAIKIHGGELPSLEPSPKKISPKYWNAKVYIYRSGIVTEEKNEKFGELETTFDSRKEYARFQQLQLLEKAGKIRNLRRQVPIVIEPAFEYRGEKIRAIVYRADFAYLKDGEKIIEDVKGISKTGEIRQTADFKLKWKLLKKRYPEYVFEIF